MDFHSGMLFSVSKGFLSFFGVQINHRCPVLFTSMFSKNLFKRVILCAIYTICSVNCALMSSLFFVDLGGAVVCQNVTNKMKESSDLF